MKRDKSDKKKSKQDKKKKSEITRREANELVIPDVDMSFRLPELPKDLARHVRIDTDPIKVARDQATLPGWIASYGFAHAEALSREERTKAAYDDAYSLAWERLAADRSPKPSIEDLKRAVILDKSVKKAAERLILAKEYSAKLSHAIRALGKKGDMLVQIGADNRLENKSHNRD